MNVTSIWESDSAGISGTDQTIEEVCDPPTPIGQNRANNESTSALIGQDSLKPKMSFATIYRFSAYFYTLSPSLYLCQCHTCAPKTPVFKVNQGVQVESPLPQSQTVVCSNLPKIWKSKETEEMWRQVQQLRVWGLKAYDENTRYLSWVSEYVSPVTY